MADSENSRTLPSCTHRNLLFSVEDFLTGNADPVSARFCVDPALAKWDAWQEAYRDFCQISRLQQHLETEMLRTVGEPYIEIEVPGEKPAMVKSDRDIELFLPGPELAEARENAKAALKKHYSLWNVADKLSGYSRALQAEDIASEREQAAARALWETQAKSLEGIIAKLHVLITLGVLEPDCDDFPWKPLRSVLADLLEMSRE
ncbi:hypothetical protein [Brucella intermedia]|uniref:hypothetical protein n=1 Tax=Brucella intermedia TaxID=94625 RepID=UPI00235E0688|nr:hypothetical protein [Brucella intermedia]